VSSVSSVYFVVSSNILFIAHEAMIQQRVLHGDLSPNNFMIHEGIRYFIDFDHASIIKEGETFTVSFGTVSLNVKLVTLAID
jgi:tRNA A-37 threonylcarbamoyl transferase component Bud32